MQVKHTVTMEIVYVTQAEVSDPVTDLVDRVCREAASINDEILVPEDGDFAVVTHAREIIQPEVSRITAYQSGDDTDAA